MGISSLRSSYGATPSKDSGTETLLREVCEHNVPSVPVSCVNVYLVSIRGKSAPVGNGSQSWAMRELRVEVTSRELAGFM